jgi:hypothetical protein
VIRALLLILISIPLLPAGSLPALAYAEIQNHEPGFNSSDGGEVAVYEASWNGVPIASARIQARPLWTDGEKFYQVRVQARTWKYLDLIWKMRDSVESVFEAQTLRPRRFVFRQRENRKRIDTTAVFDPEGKKWSVNRRQGDKVKEYEFFSQQTLDPISALYWVRSLNFNVGDTLPMEVFGGKSRYRVVLEVVGKERITLRGRDFDTYKIVPRVWNLTSSGYAARVRQATVWISADEKKRPLKVVSQVFIGSVNIEMVHEELNTGHLWR